MLRLRSRAPVLAPAAAAAAAVAPHCCSRSSLPPAEIPAQKGGGAGEPGPQKRRQNGGPTCGDQDDDGHLPGRGAKKAARQPSGRWRPAAGSKRCACQQLLHTKTAGLMLCSVTVVVCSWSMHPLRSGHWQPPEKCRCLRCVPTARAAGLLCRCSCSRSTPPPTLTAAAAPEARPPHPSLPQLYQKHAPPTPPSRCRSCTRSTPPRPARTFWSWRGEGTTMVPL